MTTLSEAKETEKRRAATLIRIYRQRYVTYIEAQRWFSGDDILALREAGFITRAARLPGYICSAKGRAHILAMGIKL